MTLKALRLRSFSALFVLLFLYVFVLRAAAFGQTAAAKSATIEDIRIFFKGKQKTVLTFVGYSGAGYEDEASMRKYAERILGEYDPAKTIVNRHRCDIRNSKTQGVSDNGNRIVTGKAV